MPRPAHDVWDITDITDILGILELAEINMITEGWPPGIRCHG
jgi:hypothetical protein